MKWQVRGRELDLAEPVVMGVLNMTPDSFSGDGLLDKGVAAMHAQAMLEQGAMIIDVGGESTRPGADVVAEDEERRRVLPLVERLAQGTDAVISIDTRKPGVAAAALEAGAHVVNDITGLRNEAMLEVVVRAGAGVVIMHMQGTPETMQKDPHYEDVVREVGDFFEQQIRKAEAAGLAPQQIVLDPGIGFGKTLEHNLALLRATGEFRRRFPRQPLLIGASRKSFLGKLTGREEVAERVAGTVAVTALVVAAGANMVRVHDVAESVDALRVARALHE